MKTGERDSSKLIDVWYNVCSSKLIVSVAERARYSRNAKRQRNQELV